MLAWVGLIEMNWCHVSLSESYWNELVSCYLSESYWNELVSCYLSESYWNELVSCYLSESYQSSRNLFQVCRTKCPTGLQYSAGHFDPLLDIFLSWWSGNMSGNSCLPCWTFSYIETCWTKCPAMSEPSAGHQQKSVGHVRHISRGLVLLKWIGVTVMLPEWVLLKWICLGLKGVVSCFHRSILYTI